MKLPSHHAAAIVRAIATLSLLAPGCGRDREHSEPAAAPPHHTTAESRAGAADLDHATAAEGRLPARKDAPIVERFPSLAAAVTAVLEREPQTRVLAVGELHLTEQTRHLRSALSQFFAAPFELVAARTSDLVMETWAPPGRCGATERKVETRVAQAIERPAAVLDEVGQALYKARDLGATPHVLRVDCKDYERVLGPGGEVDFEAFLLLVTEKLGSVTASVLRHRGRERDDATPAPRSLVIVYSGALHNDVQPAAGIEDLSYAARLGAELTELDLLVPALADAHALTSGSPWFAAARAQTATDKVVLVRRGPRSYAALLPIDLATGAVPAAAPSP